MRISRRRTLGLASLVVVLLTSSAIAQQAPSLEAETSGSCSPNILSNQGQVQFTCNTAVDAVTAEKIVSLLNQLLKKEGSTAGPTGDINCKLDEILAFMRNQAEESRLLAANVQQLQVQSAQRHLTEEQKAKLIETLKSEGPQEFYFVAAPDAETTYYKQELLTALLAAGWKPVAHPPNWPTFESSGTGLQIWISDGDTKNPPHGAVVLKQAFDAARVESYPAAFFMMTPGKFGIYLGVRIQPKTSPQP